MDIVDLFIMAKGNTTIQSSFAKALNQYRRHSNIAVSISGGKDSDLILDIMSKIDDDKKIRYIWFDTGIEYQATKDHLSFLEKKYDIKIERIKAVKPIPLCCKTYGQPFLSKYISEQIESLQRNQFKFEDKPFEDLCKEYPKCNSAIRFWCNRYTKPGYKTSMFDIGYYKYLKEYLIANPPQFAISRKCCIYAKKKVSHDFIKTQHIDLIITGIRKAEGGIRSSNYKSCSGQDKLCDSYRPIFWYSVDDTTQYDELFDITHSDCYSKWGFTRTGCAGCPFNSKVEQDLAIVKQYEPKIYNACMNIFKDTYKYTRQYKEFIAERKLLEKEEKK